MRSIEMSFNSKYGYDWVFSYFDVESGGFPEELRRRLEHMVTGNVIIEEIKRDNPYFNIPESIDRHYLKWKGMSGSRYGLVPNHKYLDFKLKNRFHSYGFQFLPTLSRYRYVCNVDIGTALQCNVDDDFFRRMKTEEKAFGFSYAPVDSAVGVKTLFGTYLEFINQSEESGAVSSNNLQKFIINEGVTPLYTQCNMDSNMGIVDMDILRSEHYKRFFNHMDAAMGLFYERWTDYNLKTLYFSTYVDKDKILYIADSGYNDLLNRISCPINMEEKIAHKCVCDPRNDLAFSRSSCLRLFFNITGMELPKDVEVTDIYGVKYKRARVKGKTYENMFKRLEQKYRELFL
ncbi:hypothetical protein FOA43_002538 [Brettanomyces nanus]|uniref:Uncharacterized protein n=1 Tax=Eeniella nana TaxID=13502 RepID=A0A875S2K9_EENNA|nr:uncharacterized protein FOA43_002538 [Brettanomyces nanus]QPG75188.1 hypothetical protein FOA43_002538 [Brettanomyces nanus]